MQNPFPRALEAPLTKTTLITRELIDQAVKASRKSPRQRIILPLHKNSSSNLHRMLNAMQPGSYIQPHQHAHPPKAESIIILQGSILNIIFEENGKIAAMQRVGMGSINLGVDSEPCVFHTFLALEKDTVLFEVKPGPYEKSSDKDFAPWAPREGSHEASLYIEQLYNAGKQLTGNSKEECIPASPLPPNIP